MNRSTPVDMNTLAKKAKAQWLRAFHARKGIVAIFSPYRRHNGDFPFPPYYLDSDGYGLGFVENGNPKDWKAHP